MNQLLNEYVRQEDFFAQEGIVLTEEVKALRQELIQERLKHAAVQPRKRPPSPKTKIKPTTGRKS